MTTDICKDFGASVRFADKHPGLFLVVGQKGDPSRTIQDFAGTVVMPLGAGSVVLASLTLTNALALQKEKSIRAVGGVHLDVQRYKALMASLAATAGSLPRSENG
jgi:hypothetical protein